MSLSVPTYSYPAGHLYIHKLLYALTGSGNNIAIAQQIYGLLYIVSLALSCALYYLAGGVPNWTILLLPLSKRLHSIFALRLFNDCWSVVGAQAAILMFAQGWDTIGILTYRYIGRLVHGKFTHPNSCSQRCSFCQNVCTVVSSSNPGHPLQENWSTSDRKAHPHIGPQSSCHWLRIFERTPYLLSKVVLRVHASVSLQVDSQLAICPRGNLSQSGLGTRPSVRTFGYLDRVRYGEVV